jgi:ketosteroid isomerase-like protein
LLESGRSAEIQASLSDADVEAIRHLEGRWLSEELAGNLSGVLDLCSEDVVWLPPGLPALEGKAAIQAWLKGPSPRIEDLRLSNVRLRGHASLAYKLADFRTRYVPAGSDSSITIAGTHLWVLRRQPGSVWRVALVAWTVFDEDATKIA